MSDFSWSNSHLTFMLNKWLEVWKEELVEIDKLEEVWVQVRWLLPKWCEWAVIDQCVSSFELLLEID